jgi:hypothetical protein
MGSPASSINALPRGTVSPSDILTTLKNVTQAINQAAQAYLSVQGIGNSGSLSATALVKSGAGRCCAVSVTTPGSTAGVIYDSTNIGATSNPIYSIAPSNSVQVVNLPVSFGIVFVPGTGMVAAVSYS